MIREIVKKERESQKMSMAELARRSGINYNTLCGFLVSGNNLSLTKLEKVLDALNLVIVKHYE